MKMTDARRLRMGPAGLAVATLSAVVVLALGGCSGAGMSSRTLTEAPVQLLAADQMTVLTLLRGWLKVLYFRDVPPGDDVGRGEFLPDGTWHEFGTDGWGNPYDLVLHPDGSGTQTGTTRAGIPFSSAFRPVSDDASAWVVHYTVTYRDMTSDMTIMTIEYDWTGFRTGVSPTPTRKAGSMALPDGRKLEFLLDRPVLSPDRLSIGLPGDDIALTCEVPVIPKTNRGLQPRHHSSLTGTARAPSGDITFSMTGADGVWAALTLSSGGITGRSQLDLALAGGGTFKREGKALGVLGWTDGMIGRLDLTSLETVEITPVAAARDLSIDRWISGSARLGPG